MIRTYHVPALFHPSPGPPRIDRIDWITSLEHVRPQDSVPVIPTSVGRQVPPTFEPVSRGGGCS